MQHLKEYCDKTHPNGKNCFYCKNFVCIHCQGIKSPHVSTLTTDCVGRQLTLIESYAILQNVINYRDNYWLFETKKEGEERELENIPPSMCEYLFYSTANEMELKQCLPTK